jgi:hypothetical protein
MIKNYPLMAEIEDSSSPSDKLLQYLTALLEMEGSLAGPVTAELLRDVGRTKVSYENALKSAQFPPDLVLAAAKYRGPAANLFSADISFSEAVAKSQVIYYLEGAEITDYK